MKGGKLLSRMFVCIVLLCLLVVPDLIMTTIKTIEKKRKDYFEQEIYLKKLELESKRIENEKLKIERGEPKA